MALREEGQWADSLPGEVPRSRDHSGARRATMFELPEFVILARQFNETLTGKRVRKGSLGTVRHKFVWYNRTPQEFETETRGKSVGKVSSRGKWLFAPLEPGFVLVLGECGGKVLFHPAGVAVPKKYHLCLSFEDGSSLTVTTQMWGAMELYQKGEERHRKYIRDMRPTPIDAGFTLEYFSALVDEIGRGEKRSAKGLLTQEQLIPGLGNAIAQDILFRAKLHPRHPVEDLGKAQIRQFFRAIQKTVAQVIELGGRYDECDLYNHPGGYVRLMDKNAAGKPCPECGKRIEKIQYLGGACYFCPRCQT
jgi:formamidopyrimidine-DNA glycosylase